MLIAEHPQQHPSRASVLEETVYRQEDERDPGRRDQPVQMARHDVQVMLAAEHPQRAAEQAGEEMQPRAGSPRGT